MPDLKLPKSYIQTKIVATIGPSCWDDAVLEQMIEKGVTVARINASFADQEELKRVSKQVRQISEKVALMIDTQGHKIRVNKLAQPIEIKDGGELKIGTKEGIGDIWVNYEDFLKDVKAKHRVLIDDGNISLIVKDVSNDLAICDVVHGGTILTQKTVNLPDTHLTFPLLTPKDKEDIQYAVENDFDFVAVSFIRNVTDIVAVRELTMGSAIKIIAKIENAEGVENFDSILRDVDGIMIARGDLGVEFDAEKVPSMQKRMIRQCRELGKPVIVATQMLESMRENPRPTRAEISDVANAVFDGADAVMLSAETSTGKFPVEAVDWMSKICKDAESNCKPEILHGATSVSAETDAVARCVVEVTFDLPINKIVVGTKSGATAMSVARHRPGIGIIAFVNTATLMHQLNIVRGVVPVYVNEAFPSDRDWLVRALTNYGIKQSILKKEDMIVLVTGSGIVEKYRNTIMEVAKVFDIAHEG